MFCPVSANYSCKSAACPVPLPRQAVLEVRPPEAASASLARPKPARPSLAARCTAHDRLACRNLRQPPKPAARPWPPQPARLGKASTETAESVGTPRSSNLLPTLANTFVNQIMCLLSVSRNLFLQSLPRPAPAGRSRSSSTSPRAGAGLAASQPGKASAGRQGAECGSGSRTQPRRPTQGVGWSAVAGPPPRLERSC